MTKARDLSKLLSTGNGKIAGSNLDVSFENINDTGTEGTKVASGTTAQRGSTAGQFRFNTTTGLAEYSNGSAFKSIDTPPTVTSIDDTEVDSAGGGNQTIVITGTGFGSGAVASFIGTSASFNAATTTVNSTTQITAVAPKSSFLNAQEPYAVKVTNISGLAATLADQINVDNSPNWSTASGTIANIEEDATGTHATVSAADPEGETIAYSETTSVLSGGNFSLNTSSGAITGDPTNVGSVTTYNFTLRATANSKNSDRAFNIIVAPPSTGGNLITTYSHGGQNYKIHKFTANGNFVLGVDKTIDYLIIGGGGGGGMHSGAGGGSGGLVWLSSQSLTAGTFPIVIGAGGANATNNQTGNHNGGYGAKGSNSTFNSKIALGGGGGSFHGGFSAGAQNGGSGGGGARGGAAGTSIQNSTYGYGVGFAGAYTGSNGSAPNYAGYAGGGTGQAGQNRTGGDGNSTFVGDATTTTAFLLAAVAGTDSSNAATTGSSSGTLYIGGGGGGSDQAATSATYPGGKGGGGAGNADNTTPTQALGNTGSGSGGQSYHGNTAYGYYGGSGLVIIRYTV